MSKITTEVEALDVMSQLGKELVVEYEAENATVATIVAALLAFQVLEPNIVIDETSISEDYSALTRSIKVDGDTILRALFRLRDTVGGYIYVDNDRKLQWDSSLGDDEGQQIRYRKNLKGIERDIDYSQLFNRIYAYGEGEGDARITLPAPGYIEDEAKQTEWGGIYTKIIVEKSITHPDTLLAYAQQYLDAHKDPPISYRIDAVDLSHSEEIDFSFEALQLGSTIKAIDDDLGIDVSVHVVKIEHPDLLHPEQMTLELANRTKDITDILAGIYDLQQFGQHIATKIGAGQVIVLGEFTVIDWVSEGTTNIRGDYIRTGVIQSNNWGVGAGSQFNLNDGTFKLGGSSAPKLSWNGTALVVTGTIYATAGEFAGTLKATNVEAGKTLTVLGAISAAGGKVKLDADSIHIYGTAEGDYFFRFYDASGNQAGRLGVEGDIFFICAYPSEGKDVYLGAANGLVHIQTGEGLTLEFDPGTHILPASDNAINLGSASKQFYGGYFASRLKIPVGTDMYD